MGSAFLDRLARLRIDRVLKGVEYIYRSLNITSVNRIFRSHQLHAQTVADARLVDPADAAEFVLYRDQAVNGFILWVQLPEKVDSLELYKLALQSGITLAPGHVFSATSQYPNFIRLNAATFNYATERAIEKLGAMVKDLAKEP